MYYYIKQVRHVITFKDCKTDPKPGTRSSNKPYINELIIKDQYFPINRSYLGDESLFDGFLFHQMDLNHQDIPDQSKRRVK